MNKKGERPRCENEEKGEGRNRKREIGVERVGWGKKREKRQKQEEEV